MSKRGCITMTAEAVRQHQEKNGFIAPVKALTIARIPEKRRGRMNKTETEFSLILEAQKRRGEIEDWKFEAMSLTWGDGMRYMPDFMVFRGNRVAFIEVKGGHIWSRDSVRFRGCAAEWKHRFDFEMHQKKQGAWSRIL